MKFGEDQAVGVDAVEPQVSGRRDNNHAMSDVGGTRCAV